MSSQPESLVQGAPNFAQEVALHHEEAIQNENRKSWLAKAASRTALSLALAAGAGAATGTAGAVLESHPQEAVASTGGYPDADATDCSATFGVYSWCKESPPDWLSPRGYGYRNCTDWVAWRIKELTGVTVPTNLGHGTTWDDNAPNSYIVDNTPEPGDIAQWDNGAGGLGHVAVVETVNANGSVNVSQYNRAGDGNFSTENNRVADHYIDVNGEGVGTEETVSLDPAVVSRTPSSMDAFYRDSDGSLVDKWWDATVGWQTTDVPDTSGDKAMAGNPDAVSRTPTSMDVFYRDVNNRLINAWWDASTGWHTQAVSGGGNMAGDPDVISRSQNGMDVLYRNTAGQLVDAWWTPTTGWQNQVIYGTPVMGGDPDVVSRTPTSMDVLYRGNDGRLYDTWWDASAGWHTNQPLPGTSGANAVVGDPSVVSRTPNSMDVLYRTPSGQLVDEWWDSSVGWQNQVIYGTPVLGGDPEVVSRGTGSMDVLYKTNGEDLYNSRWSSTSGWSHTKAGDDIDSDPAVVSRSSNSLDVLIRDNDNLPADVWWDASSGWHTKEID